MTPTQAPTVPRGRLRPWLLLLTALPALAAAQSRAQPSSAPGAPVASEALSARNANYVIDVTLDHENRMLHGSQTLTWTNLQERPTNRLWFHLYWNAWRNRQSTWMREDRIRGRSEREGAIAEGDWSYLEVDAVRLVADAASAGDSTDVARPADAASGVMDLTRTMYFAFPDDRNTEDRTVMVVLLPRPVAAGETVVLEMDWRAKIPRTFARTGFRGDYYFIAHWFPKLGVYESAGWNCHQFHAGTEFFSDYGTYDVSITVPEQFVLGATGRSVEIRSNGDGTATHRHVQEDVHAFTWTASPDYLVVEDRFEEEGLPAVDIRLLVQPEHYEQAPRHLAATKVALDRYGRWYGPYPYGHVTVVDPAYGSGAGGMEYPTLFTAGTRLSAPFGGGRPESVTIHEAGHQFWYGIVGNNEFEHAWLDEGLNTYSTLRAGLDAYGEYNASYRFFDPPRIGGGGFISLLLDGVGSGGRPFLERLSRYRATADHDAQSVPSFRYYPASGGNISYSKTALWLRTLENWIGWEDLQRILSTFFERWKFGHPTAEDFIAVADELTDQDVSTFLRGVMGSLKYDYAIQSVATFKAANEGFVGDGETMTYASGETREGGDATEPGEAGAPGEELFRSEVVVRRRGEGVFPVEVLMVFEDGHEVRRQWVGRNRWVLYTEEYPARLAYASVDPEGILALDLYPSNNTMQIKSEAALPAWKWAARWTVWFQDFLSTFATFV